MNTSYELADKYKTGFDGHGGPYFGLENTIELATERLLGNKDLVSVYIYDRGLETYIARIDRILSDNSTKLVYL